MYRVASFPHPAEADTTQTVGGTVDEAAFLYTLMERSCDVQLKIEAAAANGVPKVYVDDDAAAYTFRWRATLKACTGSFSRIWNTSTK